VVALQGWCLTIGIELALAADIRVAARDTRFGQIEIKRGIFPFGGATLRLPQVAGWGDAMRYLLTGDTFDAAEALRIGLVQELTEPGEQLARALAIAETVARQAPLAVQGHAPLRPRRGRARGPPSPSTRCSRRCGQSWPATTPARGLMSFLERREARFTGR
jgi:enoyl-CoA hydratase